MYQIFSGFNFSQNWKRYRERLHKNTFKSAVHPNKSSATCLLIYEKSPENLSQILCFNYEIS